MAASRGHYGQRDVVSAEEWKDDQRTWLDYPSLSPFNQRSRERNLLGILSLHSQIKALISSIGSLVMALQSSSVLEPTG